MSVILGDYASILSGGVGHSGGSIPDYVEVLTRGHWNGLDATNFTNDFKTAARANVRRPAAMVRVTWADSAVDTSQSVSPNDVNRIDRTGQLFNGETDSGQKWAYIHSGLIADGSFYACPDLDSEAQMGWFGSSYVGDGAGEYATDPYIDITHDARAYAEITVAGDSAYDEYPVDFTVTFTHTGGPTVITVTGNSDRVYEESFTAIADVTAVRLTISKWSEASTVIKITQFSGSLVETYYSDDIVELNILEETNSDTGAVPIGNVSANEIDLTLLNTDRRFSHGNTGSAYNATLISGRKIEVWLGFALPAGSSDASGDVTGYVVVTDAGIKTGFMPYGIYWSKDWISGFNSQGTHTTGYDIVYKLSQLDFIRSMTYSGDVTTIINTLMTAAQVDIPDLTWEVSTDLAAESWGTVIFENKSYLETIKDICEASLSYAYVNRNGTLIVGSRLNADAPTDSYQQLAQSDFFNYESNPKLDELINFIRVGYTVYRVGTPGSDIYTDDDTLAIPSGETELSLYIAWETKPVDPSSVLVAITPVTGAPLLSSYTAYANGADVTITGVFGDTFTIGATGTPYELFEITETTAQNAESINIYGVREFALIDNRLITSIPKAQALADSLLSLYGGLRNDGSIRWPTSTLLAVGDSVEVVEFKDDAVETKTDFIIKRQNTTFAGSLEATAELKRG